MSEENEVLSPEEFSKLVVHTFKPKVSATGKTVKIRGKQFSPSTIQNLFPKRKIKDTKVLKFLAFMEDDEKVEFFSDVYDQVVDQVRTKKRAEIQTFMGELVQIDPEDMKQYTSIMDVTTGSKLMLCKTTQRLIDLDVDFWQTNLPFELKNEVQPMPALLEYDPYTIHPSEKMQYKPHPQSPSFEVLKVNLYNPPEWRFMKEWEEGCPEVFNNLIEHLIPDVACREYVLKWVRNCITGRNETYLVLNGAKGIGKNLFTQLLRELIGGSNYGKAPRSFLTKEFNSVLENRRLILVDEQSINTPDKLDVLKDYANSEQNLEKKGKDADKTISTYTNFIIANNREVDLKVEQDDRRFSVIDLTMLQYLEVYEEEELNYFLEAIMDQDMICSFGNYILEDCDFDYPINQPWKGTKFDRLVKVSLWEWQKFIVATIESREEEYYDITRLKIKYKQVRSSQKSNLTADLLKDFLTNYRYNGKSLGEVVMYEGSQCIKVSKNYMPDSIDMRELL